MKHIIYIICAAIGLTACSSELKVNQSYVQPSVQQYSQQSTPIPQPPSVIYQQASAHAPSNNDALLGDRAGFMLDNVLANNRSGGGNSIVRNTSIVTKTVVNRVVPLASTVYQQTPRSATHSSSSFFI
jgi:hypothetical protein